MIEKRILLSLLCTVMLLFSCSAREQVMPLIEPVNEPVYIIQPEIKPEKEIKDYNFKFTGHDINIDDPQWDRRSYYKIYIDKVEAGRTTIGLESQMKNFDNTLPSNRHLLVIEKWVLDEKKSKYVKLNNIEQPKPNYIYFDILDDKIVNIIMKNDPFKNRSVFFVEFEE